MSRYSQEDYDDRRGRNRSPDYHSGGGRDEYNGANNYNNQNYGANYGANPNYDPRYPPQGDEPFQREEMHLVPPPSQQRHHSVPPHSNALVYRDRSPSEDYYPPRSRGGDSRGSSRSRRSRRERDSSPLSRARGAMEDNFTNSTAGLGASLLGAVVGGFVANKASDAALKNRDKGRRRRHSDENMPRAVSTILGAVAGGLGANAIANRVEDKREHGERHKHGWEGRRDDDYYEEDRYDYRRDDYRDDGHRRHHRRDDY